MAKLEAIDVRMEYYQPRTGSRLLAIESLSAINLLILVGVPEPVAFFAYPGRPTRLVREGCEVLTLGGCGDDLAGALEALAAELDATKAVARVARTFPDDSPVPRLEPGMSAAEQLRQAEKESAAIIGFSSAIAAYGAFFIPKGYGTSMALTGGVEAALWTFFAFYVSCVVITWGYYTRRGGLLYDVERKRPERVALQAAE